MRVTDCLVGKESSSASDAAQIASVGVTELALHSGLCNHSEFDPTTVHLPLQDRKINGNATDQAALRFAESISPVADMKQSWKAQFRLAFNSKNKFMIIVMRPAVEKFEGEPTMTIKGAPDILLPRCTTYLTRGGDSREIRSTDQHAIETVKDKWSSQGKRVILIARKLLPNRFSAISPDSRDYEQEILEKGKHDFELVGLLGIVDPPRGEIPDVVRTLRGAGIRVHMVTGDFKLTAQAIAADCGIVINSTEFVDDVSALAGDDSSRSCDKKYTVETTPIRSIVMSGPELNDLDKSQWDNLCRYDEIVFARTTPEQKLKIVKAIPEER